MYLEISGRRSGKTYRMLQEIEKRIFLGDKIVVVYPSYSMAKGILPSHLHVCPYVKVLTVGTINSPAFDIRAYDDYRWFFEEFDLYSKAYQTPIKKDGYYVTTPAHIREFKDVDRWSKGLKYDLLLDLLQHTKGKYTACTSLLSNYADYKEVSDEEFRILFGQQIFR